MPTRPSVAILLPVFNEIGAIDSCLESLAGQDYVGPLEIVVADGGSTDGTRQKLDEWTRRLSYLRTIDNPGKVQSSGLNLAAASTDAEILVRADAHTRYAPDYVSRSVTSLLESGVEAVGGPMVPEGSTPFGKAVAVAFRSRLAIGPAPFHHTEQPTEADTVYLGAMRKTTWSEQQGMRAFPSRVAEDADFYYRLRKRGGRVLVDPTIRSTYQPRQTVGGLGRQFFRYGFGKADMLYVNGEFPSWRPLGPLALVLGLAVGLVLLVLGNPWLLVVGLAAWLGALGIASRLNPLVLLATAVMHVSYGLGLLRGFLRRPSSVRRQMSGA